MGLESFPHGAILRLALCASLTRLNWDYHKTLDDLHPWIKEMPSIPEGTTIEWTLGDDDMRVGYIGGYIVIMRAFELPPR